MGHISLAFVVFCTVFALSGFGVAESQLKFDVDGNIIDDGLNLPREVFPKPPPRPRERKTRPMVAKPMPRAPNLLKADKVMGAKKGNLMKIILLIWKSIKG